GRDTIIERAGRVVACGVGLSGRRAGQQLQTLIDRIDRHDREMTVLSRRDDVATQHQMLDVARRNDHALAASEPGDATTVEKTLYLLVHPADRLNLTALVDRAGDGEALPDRRLGQGRQQGEQLGGRRTIAVDAAI